MGSQSQVETRPPEIWWSNTIFFLSVHVLAFYGVLRWPPSSVPWQTLFLSFLIWQLADFAITVGYHRLFSHRAFRASFGVRVVAAALGAAGFQGSIKWWALRHRLHHRFTDDPVHDPYAATKGLFYSHVGWIFYKPTYERMDLVDRADLETDPVIRFQHKHYVPLALFFGFVMPPMIGTLWHDPIGSFVWGGLVSRLAIWHCTFLVNSLAHWDGLQPYSDEDTSRGNLILALLTGGEGNHNFHAFPHDFRSGPSPTDWDPSKWIILGLHKLGLATGLRRARPEDMSEALVYMAHKEKLGVAPLEDDRNPNHLEIWDLKQVEEYIATVSTSTRKACTILIEGFVVDATSYMNEHPGGASLLRKYSYRIDDPQWQGASWAFSGGLNNHSRAAKRRMKELAVARFVQ